ncbi:hypothetical protein BCR61_00845 [Xanthomonas oryzae pv. oryzae]|nr:hypothetical protein BCR61_00845 [Xanthomonas oryzae pv. oryzae]
MSAAAARCGMYGARRAAGGPHPPTTARYCVSHCNRQTREPEIRNAFPNPESRIPNPESRIPNPESRIPNPESRIPNPESRIPNPPNNQPQ